MKISIWINSILKENRGISSFSICLAKHPVHSRYIIPTLRYYVNNVHGKRMYIFPTLLYERALQNKRRVPIYNIYYNVYIILRAWKLFELLKKKKRKKFNNDYRSKMFSPLEYYMRNYIKKKENALKGFCFTKTDGFTRVYLFHLVRCVIIP